MGVPQSNVARADAKVTDDASTSTAQTEKNAEEEDGKKKKGKSVTLARSVGRVTVILPGQK